MSPTGSNASIHNEAWGVLYCKMLSFSGTWFLCRDGGGGGGGMTSTNGLELPCDAVTNVTFVGYIYITSLHGTPR